MKPTTNQIKNQSTVAGTTVTEALNALKAGTIGSGTGDMNRAVYDSNNNGIVDAAESVPWAGITDKPSIFPPTSHSHTKSEVGLGNVDNTSDLDKPLSTAEIAALAGKQETLVSGTNIKTINGTSVLGSGNIVISGGGGSSIDDSITDGVVDRAPSQNAVFDALATKSGTSHTHSNATTSVAGFMSATDKTKLDGVATGATANSSNATLLSRANHTGTQAVSTLAQSGATTNQVLTWNGTAWIPASPAGGGGGGGLTTIHITGATSAYTASVGENVSIETSVACTVTAPSGLTAGQKWGVMVNNDRWDNVVNMNGQKHNNISDATMTLKANKVSVEFEMISAGYGMKVKEL